MVGREQEEERRWWRAGSDRLASGLPFGGDAVIVAVAGLLMSGGVAVIASTPRETPLTTLSFNLFMDIGLAAAAMLGAVVLRRSFDSARLRWQVAGWYVGSILFIYVLFTWANLTELLAGTTTVRALADGYVLFGNFGGIVGLVAGFNRGRAAQNRELVGALERKNDTLEFVNHMLRHDILNGTQTIQGYITLLDERLDTDDELEQYIANIKAGNDRITDLVQNVRVLMDTVSGENHRTEVDISELIEDEVAHARDRFPEATFETEIQPGVTALANSTFRAVIANLLQNAVEHNDTEVPTVSVSVTSGTDTVTVRVADDGPGFPEGMEIDARQEDSRDQTDRGIGIGLYLVEVILGAIEGSIAVTDNEPRGAVVTIELDPPERYSPG
jgi:two-component system OmpR family sensor kinase